MKDHLRGSHSIRFSSQLSSIYSVARVPITVGLLLYLAYRIIHDWEVTREALVLRWHPPTVLLAASCGIGAYLLLVFAWIVLLRHNRYFDKRYIVDYFCIWFVAYIYRYVPGKIMVITERVRMGMQIGIPGVEGGVIAFLETVLVLSAAVWSSSLVVPTVFGNSAIVWSVLAGFVLLGFVLSPSLLRHVTRESFLSDRLSGLSSLRLTPMMILAMTSLYVLFWILLGGSFFFFSRLFHPFRLSALPFVFALFTLSYASGVMAVFVPGGIGVREGVLAFGLSKLIPTGPATALALGSRIWFTSLELLLYFLALTILKGARDVRTE